MVVPVGLTLGKEFGEKLQCVCLHLVCVHLHFILGHLLLHIVVALVHLSNKVEHFGFLQDDDLDVLALLLVFVELTAKHDDVCKQSGHCGCAPHCQI